MLKTECKVDQASTCVAVVDHRFQSVLVAEVRKGEVEEIVINVGLAVDDVDGRLPVAPAEHPTWQLSPVGWGVH